MLMALGVQLVFAQQKTVSGTVSDENGLPLPGATVIRAGTSSGTSTDFDGKYQLRANSGDVLEISYVGYTTQSITVGKANTYNVSLTLDNTLDEVVVTALGVKAKPRELAYAVQTISADEIENTNEVNIASSLASKSAGVQVTTSSGSVGASANIRIRGNTSINRSNSPLFVVGGVPIDNSSSLNETGGVDNSNRAIDINQNDIASINILKGTAAQALYGLRASNGVILITTKSGKSGKPKVTISSSLSISEVTNLPELQKKYAQGRPTGGQLKWRGPETGEGFSWGPAISSLEFDGSDYAYDKGGKLVAKGSGNGVPARAYDNYNFFVNGVSTDLNISVGGGNEKVKYFVSAGKNDQTGTSPTEKFSKKSFRANINSDLSKKINLSASGTYVTSGGTRVQRGSNISGIMLGLLRTTPTFDNGNGLSGKSAVGEKSVYQLQNGKQRSYRGGIYDNPFWTVAKNPSTDDVKRFIGNLQLSYRANDWLTIQGKYGYDSFTDFRKLGIDINSATDRNGSVIDRTEINTDINAQLLFLLEKDLNEKVNLSGSFGYDQYKSDKLIRRVKGLGLTIPGFFHITNSATQVNNEDMPNRRELRGLFGQAVLSYNNLLFVNAAYRLDWSSTLPYDNNSFDSYGLSASFIFSDLMDTSSFLNYGKLRLSYGKSGNDAPEFSTITYYTPGSAGGDGFIDNSEFPLLGQVAFERVSLLGNNDIKPESTTEYEIGTELKFFDSRIGLDLAYYEKKTTDQIINVTLPATTGYTNRVVNAGVISNKGWEATLNINPIKKENFNWNSSFNFTKYESVVEELIPGIEPVLLNGFTSTSSRAVEGESYGAIFGTRWLRDANGKILVDDNGLAIKDPTSGVVGDPIPDFTLGFRNSIKYKNFNLTTVLDLRKGGDVWCGTCGIIDYFGVSKKTGELREQSYVVNGVRQSDGQPNTTAVAYANPAGGLGANRWVRYGFGGISEDNVYDGSYIKLREISLSYKLSEKILNQIGFSNIVITASGRNLLLLTKYPGIDPETNLTGDSNGIGLDYFNQPFTRSYALSLRLTF